MGRRILVTGANGFIGRIAMDIFAQADWEIIPLVRRAAGFKNEVVADFCDYDFPKVINSLPKVNTVVHLGAKVSWDKQDKHILFTSNVLATAELVNWANRIGAYFIFASTAIVCGAKTPFITARTIINPDTDYAYSKWLAEEMILMSGIKHTILRIAGVFGKNGPAHLGINKAIDSALNGVVPVQYGDGKAKRNYIYVKDLSRIIKFCIDNEVEGTHLVAGLSVNSISEMLKVICATLLEGKELKCYEGENVQDQVVEHSSYLPCGHSFEEAIKDIGCNT